MKLSGRITRSADEWVMSRSCQRATFSSPTTAFPRSTTVCSPGGNSTERNGLNLPEQIKFLGLEPHVCFLDGMEQAELARYFRRAKVFAGSSQHETFGLLPLEARACGTPTVVRENSSYALLAESGYGGYLSDDQSESDMADKIARILSLDCDQWGRMSRDATDSARRYSWSVMARKCQEVCRDIISKSRKL